MVGMRAKWSRDFFIRRRGADGGEYSLQSGTAKRTSANLFCCGRDDHFVTLAVSCRSRRGLPGRRFPDAFEAFVRARHYRFFLHDLGTDRRARAGTAPPEETTPRKRKTAVNQEESADAGNAGDKLTKP